MILKRVSIYLPVDGFDVYSEFYERKCSFHVAACAPKLSVGFSVLISVLSSYHFWWIECAGTSLSAVNAGNLF